MISYSCRERSGASMIPAIGTVIVMLLVILLMVAVTLSDLVQVMGDDEEMGTNEEARAGGSGKHVLVSCQAFVVKVFPVAAVKIVVVVWQIMTQVRTIM